MRTYPAWPWTGPVISGKRRQGLPRPVRRAQSARRLLLRARPFDTCHYPPRIARGRGGRGGGPAGPLRASPATAGPPLVLGGAEARSRCCRCDSHGFTVAARSTGAATGAGWARTQALIPASPYALSRRIRRPAGSSARSDDVKTRAGAWSALTGHGVETLLILTLRPRGVGSTRKRVDSAPRTKAALALGRRDPVQEREWVRRRAWRRLAVWQVVRARAHAASLCGHRRAAKAVHGPFPHYSRAPGLDLGRGSRRCGAGHTKTLIGRSDDPLRQVGPQPTARPGRPPGFGRRSLPLWWPTV